MPPLPPSGGESPAPVKDRRPAFWAWPVILLAPVVMLASERLVPAAEAEVDAQHDLSLLAILQFQAKVVIAMHSLPGGEAGKELQQLEAFAKDDATTAALAALHGFLDLDGNGREAAELLIAKRREAPGADAVFLESVRRGIAEGVDLPGREILRSRMGWFAGLLGVPGEPGQAPDGEAIRSGATLLVMVMGLGMLGFLGLFLVGTGLLMVAVVRRKQGLFHLAFDATRRPAGVFLESFALFLASMALGNLGGWLVHWSLQPLSMIGGVGLALVWPRLRGHGWRESRVALGWHCGRGFWREIGAGFVGYLTVMPMALVGIAITGLLMGLSGVFEGAGAGDAASAAPDPVTHPAVGWMLGGWEAKVMVFVLAAILAPLLEETFFRGAFFRSLRRGMGLPLAGLLNGVLFASLHPQGWMAIPALTAMGFGFACLREWRDSLIAPVLAHAINNGVLIGGLAMVLG